MAFTFDGSEPNFTVILATPRGDEAVRIKHRRVERRRKNRRTY
jgi:hypothetical protein